MKRFAALAIVWLATCVVSYGAQAEALLQATLPIPPDAAKPQLWIYAVTLNGQSAGEARILRLADGRLYARVADIQAWRLRIPEAEILRDRDEDYLPLDAFEGATVEVDASHQELKLDLEPLNFHTTTIEQYSAHSVAPSPPSPGGFANYDLFYNSIEATSRLDGLFEIGMFNRLGVGVDTFMVQNLGDHSQPVRLDTSWTRDFPEQTRSLVLGDTLSASGLWGRPVHFGGLRYGTNFATNPGQPTFPMPTLHGEAALPTAVDLYVDNILRQSSILPPGPFRIANVPVVTGQGEVKLVIRDALGREQVVSQRYYASSQLLRAELVDDSFEIGRVRNNYGASSNDYGRPVAVAQHRAGLTDDMTTELRGELLENQLTLGAGGSHAFARLGLLTAGAAMSRSNQGTGALALAAFEHQPRSGPSLGLSAQWTTASFTQLGLQPGQLAPMRVLSGNVSWSPGGHGSLSFSWVRQDNRDQPSTQLGSVSYNINLWRNATLSMLAYRTLVGDNTQGVSINLSMGFGERGFSSVGLSEQGGIYSEDLQVQQNLPAGSGIGYRLLAGKDAPGARTEASLAMQDDVGTYDIEAGRDAGINAYRAGVSGGVGLLDGHLFRARRLSESFGLAQVPGYADLAVYVNNQVVGHTDHDGNVVLPQLQPYQSNPVRIDVDQLPLDSSINATQLDAVPGLRSGVVVKFAVARIQGALLTVQLEDGSPMPVGSIARLAGSRDEFPVAARGEVYVTGLAATNRIELQWHEQSCTIEVELGVRPSPVPRLGPYTCKGVQR